MKISLPSVLSRSPARAVRPRATRAFMTRRRGMLLSVFLIAVAVPIGGYLTGSAGTQAAIADVFRDPLAVLSGRSPGLRGEGAMFQTKPSKVGAPQLTPHSRVSERHPKGPTERVLPIVRDRPVDPAAPAFVDPGTFAAPPPAVAFGQPGPEPELVPGQFTPFADPPGSTGGSSGGGVVPDPDPDPNNPPVDPGVPPAVPEPATWMMMILGFGMIGSAIRRQNARLSATRRRAAARG